MEGFELDHSLDCIATLSGHTSWIYGALITPDNNKLASVSFDKIFIWDIDTAQLVNVLEGHSDIILSLSISPNGQTLASGSADKSVKLWNLQTGELIETLAARKDPIHSVAFSPNGELIAAGGENKYTSDAGKTATIYLWDVDSRTLIHTFTGHTLRINTIAFSPDNSILASASNDKTIRLWDVNTGEMLGILAEQSSQLSCISITPDGKQVVASGEGVSIWDLETKQVSYSIEDLNFVKRFTISSDGQYIAATTYDNIKIFNFKSRELIHTIEHRWGASISFSPDGKLLTSGDATCFQSEDTGGLVRVWKMPESSVEQQTEIGFCISSLTLDDVEEQLEIEDYFSPENIKDARKRTLVSITCRQGQASFRRKLLAAYGNQCCITDCDVEMALEAAHIIPYRGFDTNHISNGLLLRGDIHTLFDLYQISINPDRGEVVINPNLANTYYACLASKTIREPNNKAFQPCKEALSWHYEQFCNTCKLSKQKANHITPIF